MSKLGIPIIEVLGSGDVASGTAHFVKTTGGDIQVATPSGVQTIATAETVAAAIGGSYEKVQFTIGTNDLTPATDGKTRIFHLEGGTLNALSTANWPIPTSPQRFEIQNHTGATATFSVTTGVGQFAGLVDFDGDTVENAEFGIPKNAMVTVTVDEDGWVQVAPSMASYSKAEVDAALALKAADNAVVKLTGDQTVAGKKTFSTLPEVGSDASTANQVVRKSQHDTALALKTETTTTADLTAAITAANWAPSTSVTAGDRRLATVAAGGFFIGQLIQSNSARTTGLTFNATEAGNWTLVRSLRDGGTDLKPHSIRSNIAVDISSTDLNDLSGVGFFNGNNLSNTPSSVASTAVWWHVIQANHMNETAATADHYSYQIARHLTASISEMWTRKSVSSASTRTWSAWRKMGDDSGDMFANWVANAKVDAGQIQKATAVTTSPAFAVGQLIKRTASGTAGATFDNTEAALYTAATYAEIAHVAGLQGALDAKSPLASPTFTGTVGGITKAMVGLGNVDNTADTAKPVSNTQQTALDAKVSATTLKAGICHVRKSADQAVSASTATKITFNTTEFDPSNFWDETNNRYLPTVAGYYRFNVGALFGSAIDGMRSLLYIYKNGVQVAILTDKTSGAAADTQISGTFIAAANGTTDYFEAFCYITSSLNIMNGGTTGYTYFQAQYICGL